METTLYVAKVTCAIMLFTSSSNSGYQSISNVKAYSQDYQRAGLLIIDDRNHQSKTYNGVVKWNNIFKNGNIKDESNINAYVYIQDANIMAYFSFKKNDDTDKPSTIDVLCRFVGQAINPLGYVTDIRIMEMRGDRESKGLMLSGIYSKISIGIFNIDLTKGDVETDNIALLKSKNWIDIPVLFSSGIRGKITFEKGFVGQKLLETALSNWGL